MTAALLTTGRPSRRLTAVALAVAIVAPLSVVTATAATAAVAPRITRVLSGATTAPDGEKLTDDGSLYADGLVLRDTLTGEPVALPVAPTRPIVISGDGTTYAFGGQIVDRLTGETYTAPPIEPPSDAPVGTPSVPANVTGLNVDASVYFAGRIGWGDFTAGTSFDDCIVRDRRTGGQVALRQRRNDPSPYGSTCEPGPIVGVEGANVILTRLISYQRGGPLPQFATVVHRWSGTGPVTSRLLDQGWHPAVASITAGGATVVTRFRVPDFRDPEPLGYSVVFDTATGARTRATWGGFALTESPHVDNAGRFVVFSAEGQIYRHDLVTTATVLISATPTGAPAGGVSSSPIISGDGSVVVFRSTAADLGAGGLPGDGSTDLYAARFTADPIEAPADAGPVAISSIDTRRAGNKTVVTFAVTGVDDLAQAARDCRVRVSAAGRTFCPTLRTGEFNMKLKMAAGAPVTITVQDTDRNVVAATTVETGPAPLPGRKGRDHEPPSTKADAADRWLRHCWR